MNNEQQQAGVELRPTGDQLRAIARQAENNSGPSDATQSVEYVLAGWQAAIATDRQQRGKVEPVAWQCRYLNSMPELAEWQPLPLASVEAWKDRVAKYPADYEIRALVVAHPQAEKAPSPHQDDWCVDQFATAMKDKLSQKRAMGVSGWPSATPEYLSAMLRACVDKGDPVDVGNLAMMLCNKGAQIAPSVQAVERQYISPVRTVADLANNLLMMDQALPIYGAQYIEHQGRRRCIAVSPTLSRERVKDERWIGEGDELNTAIIWTRAEQPSVPDGWQLVPTVITEEMHVAAVRTIVRCTGNDDCPPRVWRAMLAAAPKAVQP